jgi:hypothetical protein
MQGLLPLLISTVRRMGRFGLHLNRVANAVAIRDCDGAIFITPKSFIFNGLICS